MISCASLHRKIKTHEEFEDPSPGPEVEEIVDVVVKSILRLNLKPTPAERLSDSRKKQSTHTKQTF